MANKLTRNVTIIPFALIATACATGGKQEQVTVIPRDTVPALEQIADTTKAPVDTLVVSPDTTIYTGTTQVTVPPAPRGVPDINAQIAAAQALPVVLDSLPTPADTTQYIRDTWTVQRKELAWREIRERYFGAKSNDSLVARIAQYNNLKPDTLLNRGDSINVEFDFGFEKRTYQVKAENRVSLRNLAYHVLSEWINNVEEINRKTNPNGSIDNRAVAPYGLAKKNGWKVIGSAVPGVEYENNDNALVTLEYADGIRLDSPRINEDYVLSGRWILKEPAATAQTTQTPTTVQPAPASTQTTPASTYNTNSNLAAKIEEYNGLRSDSMLKSGDYVRFAIGGRDFTYQVPFTNGNGNADIRLQAFVDRVIQPQLNSEQYLALTTYGHARKQKLTIVGSAVPGKNYEKDSDLVTVVLGDIEPQTAPANAAHIASNPNNHSTTPNTNVASLGRTLILDPVKAAEAWVASRYGNGAPEQPLSDRVYIPGQRASSNNVRRQYQPAA